MSQQVEGITGWGVGFHRAVGSGGVFFRWWWVGRWTTWPRGPISAYRKDRI